VRRPTRLRDVAEAVGLDVSTVSKVLNEDPGIRVRPDTEERIRAAALRLGYQPNANARNLRLRRTNAFGLLLPDITNPVYAAIVRGAVRRADDDGIAILLVEAPDGLNEALQARLVTEKRVDGLLIASARSAGVSGQVLERQGVPHVFVNRRQSRAKMPSITVDDEAGAALAARTLIESGHERLGVISGPRDVDTAVRRLAGFRAAVEAAGLAEPVNCIGDYSPAGGFDAMTRMLRGRRRPTAVFASNFLAAVGALAAANALDVDVPGDLSVIGYDGGTISGFMVPPLTSVRMPFEVLGSQAVGMLSDVIAGRRVLDVIVRDPAPELVDRGSVAPPAS